MKCGNVRLTRKDQMQKTKHKVICPECKGNGYLRVPYHLAREEVTVKCDTCKCEG